VRGVLLTVNAVYFAFGVSFYFGLLWALRLFFYPSWTSLRVDNVADHFVGPVWAATAFFRKLVPGMLVTGLVMIVTSWGRGAQLWAAVLAYAGIWGTFGAWAVINPINKEITTGAGTDEHLRELLKRWMQLNNLRFVIVTVMWAATIWYLLAAADFAGDV